MKRFLGLIGAIAIAFTAMPAAARTSSCQHLGRQLEDMVARPPPRNSRPTRACRGVHHRRHHRPPQQGQARQGQPRERHQLHDVACRLALCQRRPLRDARPYQGPQCQEPGRAAKISPYHIGTWAYVYTIGYRPDLIRRHEVRELGGPVETRDEGQARRARLRSEPLITIAAILSGGDAGSGRRARTSSRP